MIDMILLTQLIAANPETQKFCADVVGIPYASDNFSDEEWQRFQRCVLFFDRQEQRQKRPGAPVKGACASSMPVVPYDAFMTLPDA